MTKLAQIVFDQFVEITIKQSQHECPCDDIEECCFDYTVRKSGNHTLLDVVYRWENCCGKCREASVTIDITGICIDDLGDCNWLRYLRELANELLSEICTGKYTVIKEECKKCRPQPPRWEPIPCKITTVVCKPHPVVCPEIEHEVIEEVTPCVPCCKRVPCLPKHETIIKRSAPEWKCGDYSVPVHHEHHSKW